MIYLTCDINDPNTIDAWDMEPIFKHRFGVGVNGADEVKVDHLTRDECIAMYGKAPVDPLSMLIVEAV